MPDPLFPPPTLTYRPIKPSDRALLISMRQICGWGESRVEHYLDPEGGYEIYFFSARLPKRFRREALVVEKEEKEAGGREDNEDEEGIKEDEIQETIVGMGGVIVDSKDKDTACREEGRVQITSLFIYPHLRSPSLQLGTHLMSTLESLCQTKYKAKEITVVTSMYEDIYTRAEKREERGGLGRVARWYLRMGYREWKDPELLPFPGDLNPDRLHYAIFLRKQRTAVSEPEKEMKGKN